MYTNDSHFGTVQTHTEASHKSYVTNLIREYKYHSTVLFAKVLLARWIQDHSNSDRDFLFTLLGQNFCITIHPEDPIGMETMAWGTLSGTGHRDGKS